MKFTYVQIKDCKRFTKRWYSLSKEVDHVLIQSLNEYGKIDIIPFSKYAKASNDLFKVCFDEIMEISGVIGKNDLFATISKEYHQLWMELEEKIASWI